MAITYVLPSFRPLMISLGTFNREPSLTAALAGVDLRDDSSEDGSSIGYFLPKDDHLGSIVRR